MLVSIMLALLPKMPLARFFSSFGPCLNRLSSSCMAVACDDCLSVLMRDWVSARWCCADGSWFLGAVGAALFGAYLVAHERAQAVVVGYGHVVVA